ncbi:L-serine ammonia-lyase [Sphingomonas sp. ST-64]|uniref:L-serine dehydratase n=1 Tax=Sphingomonas plantiphila TaxID=3163295 RepID=A0ABW8YSD2_9SPHN
MSETRSLPVSDRAQAQIGIADLFTIGIGPSSSHTVGPMRAGFRFVEAALDRGTPVSVSCELFGSLALTGKGHATDIAVMLGLAGYRPESVDPDAVPTITETIRAEQQLKLGGHVAVPFVEGTHLVFHDDRFLPAHPNGMRFVAHYAEGEPYETFWYSIGGGAVAEGGCEPPQTNVKLPMPFSSGAELLSVAEAQGASIADIVRANEAAWRDDTETDAFIDSLRGAMSACIERGMRGEGELPGGLKVKRRARDLHARLIARGPRSDPSLVFDWVSLWALAVNEENAAGGRVVTAPTNGAAGVIPAVLRYYETFCASPTPAGSRTFLLTAAAIGFLYKKRASISAAEMGCQGEVGVACSMAAAGLAAALGATNAQIENAAEIGMEHNLGLTCDPIGGLVQIPCIERNTMGAIKAINAAYLAMHGDGSHIVSLDAVIETMRQTGEDMRSKYKETAQGGLAVNVVAC